MASAQSSSCSSFKNASGTATALSNNTTYYVRALGYANYQWSSTRASGSWVNVYSPWLTLRTAATTPSPPSVNCPGYTDKSWTTTVPTSPVSCTVTATGTGYSAPVQVLVKTDAATNATPVALTNGSATVTIPNTAGAHHVTVMAQSPSNLTSTATSYGFGYGIAGLTKPVNGTRSTSTVSVSAAGQPDAAGQAVTAKLYWRLSHAADGSLGTAGSTSGWTQASTTLTAAPDSSIGGVTATGTLDLSGLSIPNASSRAPVSLDLEVCFTYSGGSVNCTWTLDTASHVTVERLPHAFGAGFPTSAAGPGQVALFTGEFATDSTDVSVPGYNGALSLSRSHISFAGPNSDPAASAFGPGWSANLSADSGGAADLQVVDNSGLDGTISLVDGEGNALVFSEPGTGQVPDRAGTYTPADDDTAADGSKLSVSTAIPPALTYTEADGTTTTWKATGTTTTGDQWSVDTVTQPGVPGATTYSHDGAGHVTRILAALPTGMTAADCPDTGSATGLKPGCRDLRLVYGDPTNNPGQVTEADLETYDPSKTAMTSIKVATYAYDSGHHLTAFTDARTNLTTRYSYDTSDPSTTRLASITPPGQSTWYFSYDSTGRLQNVTRDPADGGSGASVRIASIVYGINATTVTTGLPNLTSSGVAQWGQAVAPTTGYAMFGQGVTVSGDAPTAVSGTGWQDADLSYTDASGHTVNTASFGAGAWQVTSTDYDSHDNTVRQLDARGTATVAALQTNASGGGSVDASDYATISRYNADIKNSSGTVLVPAGSYVTDEWAPSRNAMLADGSTAWVRPHTHSQYDQGAPNGDINPATSLPYELPTQTVVGSAEPSSASSDPTASLPADLDTISVTDTGYSPIDTTLSATGPTSGWTLGQPTSVTKHTNGTDGTAITSRTVYDSEGRVVQTRQPKSNGADAGTTNTIYYRAGTGSGDSRCDSKPQWAGLVCRTYPAAVPDSGSHLPDSYTSAYSLYLQPTSVVETSDAVTRTTTTSYDAAGRVTRSSVSVTGLSSSTAVPDTTTSYDASTGLATRQATVSSTGAEMAAVATGYDNWGRQISYAADGDAATSTTYDGAGRLATVTDPQGTTTYGYGSDATGQVEKRDLPTSLTVTGVGTFTGAYDANGTLTTQKLPGGLIQTTEMDAAGEPTGLTYSGQVTDPATGAVSTGPWLAWSQTNDALGRVRQEWTPAGHAFTDPSGTTDVGDAISYDRAYSYDGAGRLVTVNDRTASATGGIVSDPAGDTTPCTTRQYGFDADGNRTSLTTIPAASGGSCGTTGGTTTSWAIDSADRNAVSDGYLYDLLGRATTIPGRDTPSGVGAVGLGYYDTDAVRSIATSANTETFSLDAAGRRMTATTTPAGSSTPSRTLTRHYTDSSDNPGWVTDTQGTTTTTTRYTGSLGGDLGASVNVGSGQIVLTLANLHGDVVTTVTLRTSSATASSIDAWSDYNEYGSARNATATSSVAGPAGYGWLGAK